MAEAELLFAQPQDAEEGSAVLMEAFLDEGFTRHIFDFSRKNTERYLYRAFLLRTRIHLEAGSKVILIRSAGQVAGILLLKKNETLPPGRMLRLILPQLLGILPLISKIRFGNIISGLKSLKLSGEIPAPYLTLEAVGVSSKFQGQGLGKKLLQKVQDLAREDPEVKGVYLFTADKKNKQIYERYGYRVLEERREKGITAYHMFWEKESPTP